MTITLELPQKIRFTTLQMNVIKIFHMLDEEKSKEEIKLHLTAILEHISEMDKTASDWRSVMFEIANKIN